MDDSLSGRCLGDGPGFDWVSTLCDDLLLKILGFMSLKKAGQTHGLSRRWRHLWSFHRDLVFRVDDGGTLDDGTASAEVVDNVIAHYKGPKIGYLHLNIRSYKAIDAQINSWIRFAIDRDVESIWLALWEPQEPFKMTHELFCSRFLTSLFLHNCTLDLPDLVGLNSLKNVALRKVYFSRRFLRRFTSGCPVLEEMYLDERNMKSTLFVCIINPSVQILRMGDGFGKHGIGAASTIKLYAPSILYLKLEGIVWRSYTIDNVSSLVEAKIDVRIYSKSHPLEETSWQSVM